MTAPHTTIAAHRLDGVVHRYAWGDTTTLADLLGTEPDGEPSAELWMGAHPRGASVIVGGAGTAGRTLLEAIEADPGFHLGEAVAERFGQLPYLFKVLAIEHALSIQVHPSLDQAMAGFARENAAGVAIDAPHRTYRDPNHKPELIVALTDFEALCGFRDPAATAELIAALSLGGEGSSVVDAFRDLVERRDIEATVTWLLGLGPNDAAELVGAITAGAARLATETHELASTASTIARLGAASPGDPGVAVACLLNHIWLSPGEAVFLAAGNMHAYLHGVGVEIMANSDNVVRGGLTPKHIDIDELCAVTRFVAEAPPVQPRVGDVQTYATPVPEFDLTRIEVSDQPVALPDGPAIILITEGTATVRIEQAAGPASDDRAESVLERGQVLYVPHGGERNRADGSIVGSGTAWVASVGLD